MTKFQALYVKYLRVNCGGSWRWVAGKYSDRYEKQLSFDIDRITEGNQLKGANLCQEAMILLNDKVEDGWN